MCGDIDSSCGRVENFSGQIVVNIDSVRLGTGSIRFSGDFTALLVISPVPPTVSLIKMPRALAAWSVESAMALIIPVSEFKNTSVKIYTRSDTKTICVSSGCMGLSGDSPAVGD